MNFVPVDVRTIFIGLVRYEVQVRTSSCLDHRKRSVVSLVSELLEGHDMVLAGVATMSFLYSPGRRRNGYSVDHLRVAYADLLQHIDVANEELGRRGIDDDDANFHKKSLRFSFRKNVIPPTPTTASTNATESESRDAPNNLLSPGREKRDLAAAFRILAATRSADKEGDNFDAVLARDDSSASAFSSAKVIEKRVVESIRTIGEVVINAEQQSADAVPNVSNGSSRLSPTVRCDAVFEYFCEKSILSLLVDIAKERWQASDNKFWGAESSFHGVVWSPLVKAQVLETTAKLISDVRNHSALYYLLSHNHINDLIQCMLPLQQWTDPALARMMPPYVNLLKQVAIQLRDDPSLFPFLTVLDGEGDNATPTFPLFSAAMEAATGPYAQSVSAIYETCIAVVVSIMQIPHDPVQNFVCNAGWEQRRLSDHLCQRLLDRYYRIVNLTTGPVVDGVRSNAIAGQLAGLKEHMNMIHDIFWSGVRGLDVRLCESLLQQVVSVLLKNFLPAQRRQYLVVGVVDVDVIPEHEALAQVSTVFLAYLFLNLSYLPFQRMLAVSLLHENTTPLWSSQPAHKPTDKCDSYVLMPALSDIVTGEEGREACPNKYRSELLRGITGQHGEWRAVACSCLLQTALGSEAMDDETLRLLKVVPDCAKEDTYRATALEESVATFLRQKHKQSPVTSEALEHVGFLAVQILHKALVTFSKDANNVSNRIDFVLQNSPLWKALLEARSSFASEAQACQKCTGVNELFLDLVESAIANRYTTHYDENGSASFRCLLSQRYLAQHSMGSDVLIRRFRGVNQNDVEKARFYINLTLHFRALCKVIERLCWSMHKEAKAGDSSSATSRTASLDLIDKADEPTRIIGGLSEKLEVGTDLDLTGRMTFRFKSTLKSSETQVSDPTEGGSERPGRIQTLSEDIGVFRSNTHLMLVLDPSDMFVVKPLNGKIEENRGTVLSSISLRSVIAAADDSEWLHVAVRHEDVGSLVKNGNMALQFDCPGTCLIVKQYLERSRGVLRQDLLGRIESLFSENRSIRFAETEERDGEQLRAKSFD